MKTSNTDTFTTKLSWRLPMPPASPISVEDRQRGYEPKANAAFASTSANI